MNIISWIGTATSIAGSFLVALHIFILGYVAFLIGSICWGFTAVKNKDNPLLILNTAFFVANCVGLYNAFL
jgi:drug/metabolite transporter (DMT)-like permease